MPNYAYIWHRLCKPPKMTFTSSTSQLLFFLFHSFQKMCIYKKLSPTTSSSIMPIGIGVWIPSPETLTATSSSKINMIYLFHPSMFQYQYQFSYLHRHQKSSSTSKNINYSIRGAIVHFQLTQRPQYLPSISPNQRNYWQFSPHVDQKLCARSPLHPPSI